MSLLDYTALARLHLTSFFFFPIKNTISKWVGTSQQGGPKLPSASFACNTNTTRHNNGRHRGDDTPAAQSMAFCQTRLKERVREFLVDCHMNTFEKWRVGGVALMTHPMISLPGQSVACSARTPHFELDSAWKKSTWHLVLSPDGKP